MHRLKIDVMKREHNQEESCSLHSSRYHQFKICIKTRSLMDWISGHIWVPGQKFSKYYALWTCWSSRTNTKWPTCVYIPCDLFPRVWDTCSYWSETRSLLAMWLPELTAVVLEVDQCERKCQCQIFLEFKLKECRKLISLRKSHCLEKLPSQIQNWHRFMKVVPILFWFKFSWSINKVITCTAKFNIVK